LIIRVTGDLDLVTAPTLGDALDRAQHDASHHLGATELVVDLRSVRFLSAAGIRALADAQDACTGAGIRLRVVADQPVVTRPLTITGMDRLLDLRATLTR
jgi:anti-anti-sigma factor